MSGLSNPSTPPAQVAAFPRMADKSAQVLARIQARLPGTRFVKAWATPVAGLYAVQMDSGRVAYTNSTGTYFILGLLFDTTTGKALYNQLQGKPQ